MIVSFDLKSVSQKGILEGIEGKPHVLNRIFCKSLCGRLLEAQSSERGIKKGRKESRKDEDMVDTLPQQRGFTGITPHLSTECLFTK